MLKEAAKRFPWLANVTLYGCLFAGGDLAHQLIAQKERIDWKHTRNVAVVAITFHGNFNYFWLRALERRFPGKSAGMVFRKLLLDQSFASPLATSVFYTGRCTHARTRALWYLLGRTWWKWKRKSHARGDTSHTRSNTSAPQSGQLLDFCSRVHVSRLTC